MNRVELADGTSVWSGCPPQTIFNAALRGCEARAVDTAGRVVFSTADLPVLTHDGAPSPYWIRVRFNHSPKGA